MQTDDSMENNAIKITKQLVQIPASSNALTMFVFFRLGQRHSMTRIYSSILYKLLDMKYTNDILLEFLKKFKGSFWEYAAKVTKLGTGATR